MTYAAADDRYDRCPTDRCGASGLSSPRSRSASGRTSATTGRSRPSARSCAARSTSASPTSTSPTTTARRTARPRRTSGGSSATDLRAYRDELVISTKAGYDMWPGPYGDGGSRKYLLASLDQSLQRMGLDYVDIFYSHRFDPETPLEETMGALDTAVRQGKALYVGISSYSAERTREAARDPARARHAAADPPAVLLDAEPLDRGGPARRRSPSEGIGCIAFSPLAQGLLTDRYLDGVPEGSRARRDGSFRRRAAHRREPRQGPRPERDRRAAAARPSPRWRSPGRCATRA